MWKKGVGGVGEEEEGLGRERGIWMRWGYLRLG